MEPLSWFPLSFLSSLAQFLLSVQILFCIFVVNLGLLGFQIGGDPVIKLSASVWWFPGAMISRLRTRLPIDVRLTA